MSFRRCHRRRGIVNIWVVLSLFLIVGLVGLACDTGWCTLVLNQLQAAADSAALAGAQKVMLSQQQARQAAHDLAIANKAANKTVKLNLNDGNAAGGDIVLGRFDQNTQVFTPTTNGPNAVKVVANRTKSGVDGAVSLVFGQIFGVVEVELSRTAIAISQNQLGAAMIVLDPTGSCALDISGGPNLTVTGGNIHVNSTSMSAVCNNGSSGVAQISAPALNVVGSTNVQTTNAPVNTGADPIPDPLAALPEPPTGPTYNSPGNGGNVTIEPGYYPGGIRRTGGTLTLMPGTYYIDNVQRGFNVSGNASLIGHNVTIYMKRGSLDFSGGGTFILSPPPSGTYKDVTIFQARTNTVESFLRGGNSLSSITGTLYFPNNQVLLTGNSPTIGNQVIAFRVRLGGNSVMNVPYTGAFPVGPPTVYLVE